MGDIRRTCSGDDGFAMLLTIGAIALITVIAAGGYAVASQGLHESVRNTSEHRAYQAASTGLDQELSWFKPDDLSRYPVVVALGTEGDMYEAKVVDRGLGVYELQTEGRSATSTETISVIFRYLNLWDMNISGGEGAGLGSGSGFNGSSYIWGSLYVSGDMEWTSNGRIYGGPVFLKNGEWIDSGNGAVGTSTSKVDAYGPVPSGTKNYHTVLRGSPPDLDIPKISDKNMDDWLLMAKTTAKYPRDMSRPKHPNAHATDYTVLSGASTIGPVAFGNPLSDPIAFAGGTLYLNQVDTDGDGDKDYDPVIYCDDVITFTSAVKRYQGRGVIVAKNGMVVDGALKPLHGNTELVGPTGDQQRVPTMDAGNCLGLLTQGDILMSTKDGEFSKGGGIAAAIFANGEVRSTQTNFNFRGSMICDDIEVLSPNAIFATQPGLHRSLPKGMPELSGFTARGEWVRR